MRYLLVFAFLTAFMFISGVIYVSADPSSEQGDHHMAPITGSKELEKLKTLAGTWQGTTVMGGKEMPVSVAYETSSNGSVVVETLFPGTPHEMVSVYFDESGKLGMTHYCAIGNQPHFSLAKSSDTGMELVFAEGTNLDPAKGSYMHDVTFEFKDDNNMVQEWTHYENGKEKEVATFTFTRAK